MIREFALDPKLLADTIFKERYFYATAFGANSGRYLSQFPIEWKAHVVKHLKEHADLNDNFWNITVEEFLKSLSEEAIARNINQSEKVDWLGMAEAEHHSRPFDGVIAGSNPRNHPAVIKLNELLESNNDLWNQETSKRIRRTPTYLAEAVRPVLQKSKHIVFIDPYFDISKQRYQDAFKIYFDNIWSRASIYETVFVDIIMANKVNFPLNERTNNCKNILPGLLPPGKRVNFRIYSEKRGGQELHNRFILTNIAAIGFQHGLDCCHDNVRDTYDNLHLLSKIERDRLWLDYISRQPMPFEVKRNQTVVGGTS